jgi:hypothetical protein
MISFVPYAILGPYPIYATYLRLVVKFLQDGVVSPMTNPKPGGPGNLFQSRLYPLSFPAWVALPVVKLQLA